MAELSIDHVTRWNYPNSSKLLTQGVIPKLWRRFQQDGDVSRRFNTGRPPVRPTSVPQPLELEHPERTCDRLYASIDFEILSPNYPNNYPNKKVCRYTIRRLSDRICSLRLTFVSFEVESSKSCEYDFLEIEGTKLCGTLPSDDVREFDLRNFQITLIFHSDPANSRSGFRIKAQQIECGAGISGSIASPGYPQEKPHIPGGFPYPPRRYPPQNPYPQGSYPPQDHYPPKQPLPHPQGGSRYPYPPKQPSTPGSSHYPPQNPQYPPKQPSPPQSPHYPPQNPQYPPQSPQYPPKQPPPPRGPHYPPQNPQYPSKQPYPPPDPMYPPKQPYPQPNPQYPPKQPYPQPNPQYPPKQPYPQRPQYPTKQPTGPHGDSHRPWDHQPMRPQSDHHQPPGHPSYPQSSTYDYRNCDKEFYAQDFEIKSVNFPNNYPNSLNCRYTIHRISDAICRLELTFSRFDVESSSNCLYDYLSVDGDRLCGTIPDGEVRIYDFHKYQKLFYFRSDAASPRRGFLITARQVRCDAPTTPVSTTTVMKAPVSPPPSVQCDKIFSTEEFTIESPNYPEEYPNDVTCEYIIKRFASDVCALHLTFLTFDLEEEEDGGCTGDYLDTGDDQQCGQDAQNTTQILPFDTKEKTFTFRSDRSTSRSGFSIRVRQLTECTTTWQPATPPPPLCDFCLREPRGHISSTNFPQNYDNLQHCSYHVEKVKGYCAVEIYFHEFDLEEATSCNKDYLLLQRKRYCGKELRHKLRKVVFPEAFPAEVSLFFHADGDTTAPGFHLEYRQVQCYSHPWRMGRGNQDSSFWPKASYDVGENRTTTGQHHNDHQPTAHHRNPQFLSFYTVHSNVTVRRPNPSRESSG